jgi:hypothetical protein
MNKHVLLQMFMHLQQAPAADGFRDPLRKTRSEIKRCFLDIYILVQPRRALIVTLVPGAAHGHHAPAPCLAQRGGGLRRARVARVVDFANRLARTQLQARRFIDRNFNVSDME